MKRTDEGSLEHCAGRRSAAAPFRDFLLRGGRLTKLAGEVASYAASVGRAAPAALAAVSLAAGLGGAFLGLTAQQAAAQSNRVGGCLNKQQGSGETKWDCDRDTTVTVSLTDITNLSGNDSGRRLLNVYVRGGQNVNVTSGLAFDLENNGTNGIKWERRGGGSKEFTGAGGFIDATNSGGGGNIEIRTGNNTTLKSTDDSNVAAVVKAFNTGTATGGVTINVATVTASGNAGHAIEVRNDGTGAVNINASGPLTSGKTGGDGIRVFDGVANTSNGASLNITAAAVTGKFIGMRLRHRGGGDVSIIATGEVASTQAGGSSNDRAIQIENHTGSSSVHLSVATVTASAGNGEAIFVDQRASGPVTISASGAVTAEGTGSAHAVELKMNNSAAAVIALSGAVDATDGGDAVNVDDPAANPGTGGSLSISVATATGGWMGIRVIHKRGGAVTITATGTVTGGGGASGNDSAIDLWNNANASNLKVAVATVTAQGTGSADGIKVNQPHGGTVEVTATGAVTTAGRHGIHVEQGGNGAVTINVSSTVTGDDDDNDSAIRVAAGSGDAVTINLNSSAVVGSANEDAVVETGGNATLTVNTGANVRGAVKLGAGNDKVILAGGTAGGSIDFGAGADTLEITKSGAVTMPTVSNLEALALGTNADVTGAVTLNASGSDLGATLAAGTDVNVASGVAFTLNQTGAGGITLTQSASGKTLSGQSGVIHATNSGAGNISITATGDITSSAGKAVVVSNQDAAGGSVTISVKGITASGNSIEARNSGSGQMSITATGHLNSNSAGDGIAVAAAAANSANTASLNITVGQVTGKFVGMRITHKGGGAVTITATGTVTSVNEGNDDAIFLKNENHASNLKITVAAVKAQGTGTADGIFVEQDHGGAVEINAGGHVESAGRHGIYVKQDGDGDVTINVSSTVTGDGDDNDSAIKVAAGTNDAVAINLNNGAVVGSAGEDAVVETGGAATVTVKSGAEVKGAIKLGDGNDTLEFSGGTFTNSASLEGGGGTDELTFKGTTSGRVSATEWEEVKIESGAAIAFGTGAHSLTAGTLTVSANGTLDVGKDTDTTDHLTVSGGFAGGGTVVLNANFLPQQGASDKLTITGNVTGTTTLAFTKIAGQLGNNQTDADRPQTISGVVTVQGTLAAGATFTSDTIETGEVSYRLKANETNAKVFDLVRVFNNGCHEPTAGSGVFECVGAVTGATSLSTSGAKTVSVNVTGTAVSLTNASGTALRISQTGGTGGVTLVTDATSVITGSGTQGAIAGIHVSNTHGGAVLINSRGTVTGVDSGIRAHDATGGGLTVSAAGSVTGKTAIRASAGHHTKSSVSVTTTGTVNASGSIGIRVASEANLRGDAYVDVQRGTVTAGTSRYSNAAGVYAYVNAILSGNASITVGSAASVSGERGVVAEVKSVGVYVNVQGTVTGVRKEGIRVNQSLAGNGPVRITVSGRVAGGTDTTSGHAIAVNANIPQVDPLITLNSGAQIVAGGGSAIKASGGTRAIRVVVNTGASVTGAISLGRRGDRVTVAGGSVAAIDFGAGDDRAILAGGTFGGSIDFGAGADTLEVTAAGTVSIPTVSNLETLALGTAADVTSGITLSGSGTDLGVTLATGTDVSVSSGRAFTLNQTGAGGITFTQAANGQTLTSQNEVIQATNSGAGDISITATGELNRTGTSAQVVNATNEDSAGGAIILNLATVTTSSGHAVRVKNDGAGETHIKATGSLNGGSDGINLDGDENTATGASLTIDVGSVSGGWMGMRLVHKGGGDVSITATGAVVSRQSGNTSRDGAIQLESRAGSSSIHLSVAAVTASAGNGRAIFVDQHASGPVTISASGDVKRTHDSGGAHAVELGMRSSAAAVIAISGSVTAPNGGDAVNVDDRTAVAGTGGSLSISVATATGGWMGIRAIHKRGGAATITATGAVTGGGGDQGNDSGIELWNHSNASDLKIAVASVTALGTGTADGIRVKQDHGGAVEVTATGAVTSAGRHGINVEQSGNGAVTVNVSSTVTGGDDDNDSAIKVAAGSGDAVAINLNSGASVGTASEDAIVETDGNATVSVKSNAEVKGAVKLGGGNDSLAFSGGEFTNSESLDGGAGTDALTFGGGTSGRVSATGWETVGIGASSSISFGTAAHSLTAGTLTVSANGTLDVGKDTDTTDALTVSGDFAGGGTVVLNANFVDGSKDTLTITGDVTGAATTVAVTGLGQLGQNQTDANRPDTIAGVITVQGTVAANAFSSSSIAVGTIFYQLKVDGTGKAFELVKVTPGDCRGTAGAFVCSGDGKIGDPKTLAATGATNLSVTVNAEAEFDSTGTALVLSQTGAGGITLTQSANGKEIKGVTGVIHATNSGAGGISISAVGAISKTGSTGAAISAKNTSSNGGDVSVSVATVTGSAGGHAVELQNDGGGKTELTATGSISGGGDGIRIFDSEANTSTNASLNVTVGSVSGKSIGMRLRHRGGGNVSVVATGAVVSTNSGNTSTDGAIHLESRTGSSSVHLSVATVTASAGRGRAIFVDQHASGPVTISASGVVTAEGTGNGAHAVELKTRSSAAASIAISGTVTASSGGDAVNVDDPAVTAGTGGSLSISVATATGGWMGIRVRHKRGGDVTITATGAVTGGGGANGNDSGIYLFNDDHASNLKVAVATVTAQGTGSADGIRVKQEHGGTVEVTATGAVTTAGRHGINVEQSGTGKVTINVSSTVTGDDDNNDSAIRVAAAANAAVEINLNSGAVVGSANEDAVVETGGNATVEVKSGAEVKGAIKLGGGNDTLKFSGGTFADVSGVDGGAGTDALTFEEGSSGSLSSLSGWETVRIESGASIAFGTGSHSLNAGTGTLTVAAGGTLNLGKDTDTTDHLTVSGSFAGGGTITLNANFLPDSGASDKLTVTGNVNGTTTLAFTNITGNLAGNKTDLDRPDRIDGVVTVQGTVAAGAFTATGNLTFAAVAYQLEYDSTNKRFDLVRTTTNKCEPSSTPGAYTCSGANQIGGAQSLSASGATALSVRLNSETAVDTAGTAFTLSQTGAGGITLTQSGSGEQIKGTSSAIIATNTGGGAISINVNGTVTGASGDGIRATNDASGSGITITAAGVSGSESGIRAVEGGTGAVKIAATGTVTGASKDGIYAKTGASGGGITITASNVTASGGASASGDGIRAMNLGTGSLVVSAGTVSADGDRHPHYSIGVNAESSGANLTISVGDVSGKRGAVRAVNRGTGATTVTVTGTARQTKTYGGSFGAIHVANGEKNNGRGGDMTVRLLKKQGAPAEALSAENRRNATNDVLIVKNFGTGSSTVLIEGGLKHPNPNQGAALIYGSATSGDISVTAKGKIEAGNGLDVEHMGDGDVTVAVGEVIGLQETTTGTGAFYTMAGVYVKTSGTIAIAATGHVDRESSGRAQGDQQTGIHSRQNSAAAVHTVSVAGKKVTITLNSGAFLDGDSVVRRRGAIEHSGLAIRDEAGDASVIVNSGATATGKIVLGSGTDALTLNSGATVTSNGTKERTDLNGLGGIDLGDGDDTLTVNAGATLTVHPGDSAHPAHIELGAGDDTATLASGAAATGTINGGAGNDTVTISSGATLTGSVMLGSGTDMVAIGANATVTGSVTLGAGTDTLTFAGGTFSNVTGMDGGDGSGDTLRFSGGSGVLNDEIVGTGKDGLKGWESVIVESGATISGTIKLEAAGNLTLDNTDITGITALTAGAGTNTLALNSIASGSLVGKTLTGWEAVEINSGSTVKFAEGTHTLASDLTVASNGTLDVGDDSAADDALTVSGNFTGGGTVTLDVDFNPATSDTDTLTITGNVNGNGVTTIQVDSISTFSGDDTTRPELITGVVTVQGNVTAGAFTATGDLTHGTVAYRLKFDATAKRFDLERYLAARCDGDNGVYTCTGSNQIDVFEPLSASGATTLTVTLNSETPVDAGDDAFVLTQSGSGGIRLTQSAGGQAIKATRKAIDASNSGGGSIAINVNGTVTSTSGTAIQAQNDTSGSRVSVTARDVSGASDGIRVVNRGSGDVNIAAREVKGASGHGIYARGDGSAMNIQVDGSVTGGTGSGNDNAAIYAKTAQGGGAIVKVRRGATVGRAGGVAILNDSGQASVVAEGKIFGAVMLGAGDDELVFAGGDLGSATVDFGAGSDTLGFEGVNLRVSGGDVTVTRGTLNANGLTGFERISIRSGATVSGAASFGSGDDTLVLAGGTFDSDSSEIDGGAGTDELVFGVDVDDFSARRLRGWERVTVEAGRSVSFLAGQRLGAGLLTLPRGSVLDLSTPDSNGGLALVGDFAGGGTLSVSVDFATGRADSLSIGGSASGATTISIAQESLRAAAALTSIPSGGSIEIVSVRGTVNEGAFAFAQGVEPISVGSSRFNLFFDAAGKRFVLSRLDINDVGCTRAPAGSAFAFECVGNIEAPQELKASDGAGLTVSAPAGLNIRTSSGTALTLRQPGKGGVEFAQAAGGGPISGSDSGIRVENSGGGRVRVSATGKVTGLGRGSAHAGVAVASDGEGVSITAGEVVGGRDGVRVAHTGSGDAEIAVGSVTGSGGAGIDVSNSGSGNLVSVRAVSARGGSVGVRAMGRGYGAVSVLVSELASGASGHGIHASNSASGSGLSVSAGTVSGGDSGILAVGEGHGTVSISASGSVTGASGQGIDAVGGSRSRGLAVSAAAVSGAEHGVRAVGSGRGGISVSAAAGVTGGTGDGIFAQNSERGDGISISAASVTGGAHGIRAVGMGSGTVAISAAGKVEGRGRSGIHAEVADGGGGLSIAAAAVSGAGRAGAGVFARNSGTGALSILTSGSVSGMSGASGIHAVGGAGGVTVRAAAVSGAASGVRAETSNGGALEIAVSGPVDGRGTDAQDAGIRAAARGGSLSIAVGGSVTGANDGVAMRNEAAGSLRVAVASGASVSGGQAGIRASGAMSGPTEISAAGSVSGAAAGVHVRGSGSGPVSIVASAAISGGAGIDVDSKGAVSVSLRSGASVSAGGSGVAIRDGGSDMTVTLETGATISGMVSLGSGDDELNLAGGTYGSAILDGGEGRDAIRIGGEWSTESFDSFVERIDNWEELGINAAGELSLLGAYRNFDMNLDLGDGGTLSMKDEKADDSLILAGDLQGGGSIAIDADLAANLADTLTIEGDVADTTAVTLNDVTPDDAKPSGEGFVVVTVEGGAADDAFSLSGSDAVAGAFSYALTPRKAGSGKEFHLGVGDRVSDTGAAFRSAAPAIIGGFARASTLATRNAARSASAPGGVGQTAQSHSRSGGDASEAVWLRFFSDTLESEDGGDGGQFKIDSRGFQAGWDLFAPETSGGDWVLGVIAQQGSTSGESTGVGGTGRIEAEGFGFGIAATWYGLNGTYLDAQSMFSSIEADFSSDTGGALASGSESTAGIASLEIGRRFGSGQGVTIVPQAQVSWSEADGGSFAAGDGMEVELGSDTSLVGRLGMAMEMALGNAVVRASGSYAREMSDAHDLVIDGTRIQGDFHETWMEFGFGVSVRASEQAVLFLDGAYRASSDADSTSGGGSGSVSGSSISGGLRWNW